MLNLPRFIISDAHFPDRLLLVFAFAERDGQPLCPIHGGDVAAVAVAPFDVVLMLLQMGFGNFGHCHKP